MRRLAALWVGVMLLASCGSGWRDPSLHPPDQRALVRLERQAQRELHCRAPLRVVQLETRAFQVDGCGQMREYAWVCPGRRCNFQPIIPALVRASQDLQCPPAQIAGQADTPTHRAFFGCMRGAAYSLLCVDHGCTWARTPETVAPASSPTTVASAPVSVADPALADVVIPPPPGAPSAFGATTPVPAPPSSSTPTVPPPPSTVPSPTPPAPSSTPPDSIVIPPPPS